MMSNTRVFISSTSIDLQEYREAAFKAIHSLGGYSDDMIFWSADERSGATLSADRVRQSDVLILLLAHRYGHVPNGAEHSVTEMEFRTAESAGIPVLAFIVDEDIPWPPKFVETERAIELARFKALVGSKVTWQAFRSADDLFAKVTQSLVSFASRRPRSEPGGRAAFRATLGTASSQAELRTSPDALVQIGRAEDGLPLVLAVRRSHDLSHPLRDITEAVTRPGIEPPEALIRTFRQSLEQFSRRTWARERVFQVGGSDGAEREMYVSSSTLARLFNPLFAAVLEGRSPSRTSNLRRRKSIPDTAWPVLSRSRISTAISARSLGSIKELQSVGGQNRFLGISLDDGNLSSVGLQAFRWVEWRTFLFESLADNFPEASFRIQGHQSKRRPIEGALGSYEGAIEAEAVAEGSDHGTIDLRPQFVVARNDVARTIMAIASLVEICHDAGRIHGDLKPTNVILTPDKPSLIDDFSLRFGEVAPGWTPEWSAPEQVLGNPVSPAADIYPLGVMLVRLLGGRLVGEVRKFKTVALADGRDEFDIFYDPFVHIEPENDVLSPQARRAWLAFARACLSFDPETRVDSAKTFRVRLKSLVEEHPLQGRLAFSIPGRLAVVRLTDGSDRVVRLLIDSDSEQAYGLRPGPFATP